MFKIPICQRPNGRERMIFCFEVDKILDKITKVIAKIHAIRLSGKKNYNIIREKLGPLKNYTKKNWMPNYDRVYIRRSPGFTLLIAVNPKDQRFPFCYIGVYPRENISPKTYKNFLKKLNSYLPGLKVSQVEYALDLFCSAPNAVENLFRAVSKSLYIPYQKKARIFGGQSALPEIRKRSNLVYRIGDSCKIYERGLDRLKTKSGWSYYDLNRVRMEYTAKGYMLKKHKIISLDDLIRDPKFLKINHNKWQFKFFLSGKLPAPYDPYSLENESDDYGSFISEHIKARHKIKNISQYAFNLSEFIDLDYMLKYAMAEFDDRWKADNGQS